jgi:hypothetical protein
MKVTNLTEEIDDGNIFIFIANMLGSSFHLGEKK